MGIGTYDAGLVKRLLSAGLPVAEHSATAAQDRKTEIHGLKIDVTRL